MTSADRTQSTITGPWYVGAIRAANAPAEVILALETNRAGFRIRKMAARLPEGGIIGVGFDVEKAPAAVRPLGRVEFWRELIAVAEGAGAAVVGYRLAALTDEIRDSIPPALAHRWSALVRADIHEGASLLNERFPGILGAGPLGLRGLSARLGDALPEDVIIPLFTVLRASERVWFELLVPRLRTNFSLAALESADEAASGEPAAGPVTVADVRIPVAFLERAERSVAQATVRAARIGLPLPELETGERRIELVEFDTGISGFVETVRAVLTLPGPVTAGAWRFVARIDNPGQTMTENLIIRVPGTDDTVPLHYRTADPRHCDHCRVARDRRETFLVTDGARWAQVGRDCLRDFLRFDPGAVLTYLEELGRIVPDEREIRTGLVGGRTGVPLLYAMRDTLDLAARIVAREGFVSVKRAEEASYQEGRKVASSAARVSDAIRIRERGSAQERASFAEAYGATLEADTLREATFAALSELDERDGSSLSEWERNLATLWGAGYHAWRHLSVAVSALVLGHRRIERDAERAKAVDLPPSRHVGELGERLRDVPLEIAYVRATTSDYGERQYVLARCPDGVLLEWWMGPEPAFERGDRTRIVGTVKTHRFLERSGDAVTTLNRVACGEIVRPAVIGTSL